MPLRIDNFYIDEIPEEVRNFISGNNLNKINAGRYTFSDGIYLNIDSYETKSISTSKYEAHRKFIDVQYVISGEEKVCINNISNLCILEEYDDSKDCIFYSNERRGEDYLLHAGEGLIIYPEEGHIPGLQIIDGEPDKVKKMVIKLPVK